MIWNAEAETLSRAARARLQLERLRETIGWAVERVAFHRERLGGVEVRRLDDLARLPFVRKTDLRDHYPFGLFAVELGEVARLHASSGTKGKPTIVGYTAGDLETWREVMARVMTAAAFIRYNMPVDKPETLTDQDAFDVAAYMDSRPRPDFVGKENDWPNGDAPPDVAYATKAAKTQPVWMPPVLPIK